MRNHQVDSTEARRQAILAKLNHLRGINTVLKRHVNFSEKLSFIDDQSRLSSELEQSFLMLREKRFVFRNEIRDEIETAKRQLPSIYSQSEKMISANQEPLLKQIDELHKNVMQLALRGGDPLELEQPVHILEQELEEVRRAINSLGAQIDRLVSDVADNLVTNRAFINYLHWCIDQFVMLEYESEKGENIVAFTKCHYMVNINKKETKIPGVLYVTDRKFVFERREKIVKKRKWWLFASETEDMTEVVLKEPISSIETMSHVVDGILIKDYIMKLQHHQKSECLVFYVTGDQFTRWLYFQVDSLLKGTLNRVV